MAQTLTMSLRLVSVELQPHSGKQDDALLELQVDKQLDPEVLRTLENAISGDDVVVRQVRELRR
jgi:hypothetical protein